MKVKFLKSAREAKEYPYPYKPEVAVVGRSNAGKSSFVNALTGQKIAKVSGTPGKTRLLNFFEVEETLYLVDMPGYGFATGDRDEVKSWKGMIETYLRERETLRGVMLIMDIRRDWGDEEAMLQDWFNHHEATWGVLLNKADKLSRSQILSRQKAILSEIQERQKDLPPERAKVPVFIISATKKDGLNDIRNLIFKEWGK